jgi:hypothetical protein
MAFSLFSSISNKFFEYFRKELNESEQINNDQEDNSMSAIMENVLSETLFTNDTVADFHDEENILYEHNNTASIIEITKTYDPPILSIEAKAQIAISINSGSISQDVAEQFNIRRSRVNLIARKVRSKQTIQSLAGRPRAIDKTSNQILKAFIIQLKNQNLTPKQYKERIKKAIRDEYKLSLNRRNKTTSNVKMPVSTLKRYMQKFN